MEWIAIILVAAVTFGVCFLADKGFQKTFRGKKQHKSGLAVRLNRKYGAFGAIFFALGVAAVFAGLSDGWVLTAGGAAVCLLGVGLVVYYLTFGIFYDGESVLSTGFGRKSAAYRYEEILCQQLYISYGSTVLELEMTDGRTVQLPLSLSGAPAFLDKAFAGWCRQKGIDPASCSFHDPENSLWFPTGEEK